MNHDIKPLLSDADYSLLCEPISVPIYEGNKETKQMHLVYIWPPQEYETAKEAYSQYQQTKSLGSLSTVINIDLDILNVLHRKDACEALYRLFDKINLAISEEQRKLVRKRPRNEEEDYDLRELGQSKQIFIKHREFVAYLQSEMETIIKWRLGLVRIGSGLTLCAIGAVVIWAIPTGAMVVSIVNPATKASFGAIIGFIGYLWFGATIEREIATRIPALLKISKQQLQDLKAMGLKYRFQQECRQGPEVKEGPAPQSRQGAQPVSDGSPPSAGQPPDIRLSVRDASRAPHSELASSASSGSPLHAAATEPRPAQASNAPRAMASSAR